MVNVSISIQYIIIVKISINIQSIIARLYEKCKHQAIAVYGLLKVVLLDNCQGYEYIFNFGFLIRKKNRNVKQ